VELLEARASRLEKGQSQQAYQQAYTPDGEPVVYSDNLADFGIKVINN
jgi:hypothetical protein